MKYTFKLIPIIVNRLKFAKYIPTSFHLPTHEQLDQVIDILNDRVNDNNKYCYAVKRNGKIRIINRCIVPYLMITKQDYYDHLYMIISKTIQLLAFVINHYHLIIKTIDTLLVYRYSRFSTRECLHILYSLLPLLYCSFLLSPLTNFKTNSSHTNGSVWFKHDRTSNLATKPLLAIHL